MEKLTIEQKRQRLKYLRKFQFRLTVRKEQEMLTLMNELIHYDKAKNNIVLKIQEIASDPMEAIKKTGDSYGITHYDKGVIQQKMKSLETIKKFYLVEAADGLEMFYVRRLERHKMLQKFSWFQTIHSGAAAFFAIDETAMEIRIGEYKYNRDALRCANNQWTVV